MAGNFLAAARNPQQAVGEPAVAQVFPAGIMKRLGAVGRAHAVHLHDDETVVRRRAGAKWS